MNLNGNEERIQQLFGEMSRDDQQRTPRFASMLAAANSRGAHSRDEAPSLRFAMAIAMLFAVLLISVAITVRLSKSQNPAGDGAQVAGPVTPPEPHPGVALSQPDPGIAKVYAPKPVIKHVRHRRQPNQIEVAIKSLFAWQSPTAALLTTPSDDLLKSLPKLGESLQTIKSYSPDQFN
jgi:hypothetical protein